MEVNEEASEVRSVGCLHLFSLGFLEDFFFGG